MSKKIKSDRLPRVEGPSEEFVPGEYKKPRLAHVLAIYNWRTRQLRLCDNKELFDAPKEENPHFQELEPEEHMYLCSVTFPWLGPDNSKTEARMNVIREEWKTMQPQPDVPWAVQITRSIFCAIHDHMPPYSFGPGSPLCSSCPKGAVMTMEVGERKFEIEVREVSG